MQIGIRFHDTVKLPLEERIKTVREQGFSCAHLALSKALPEYSSDVAALTPGYAMYLKNMFAKYGIDLAVLGCYLNLANPNSASLAKITEKYMANIRFARTLGCGVVGTETGAPNEEYKFVPECHSDAALATFIKNLRPVIKYAESMGVILAIEPVFTHIVSTPKRARTVLDEIGSPNLQIIFDPVNLLHISNHENADEIFAETIELLGKDIAVIHMKDYTIEDGNLNAGAVGTGIMDYTRILKFIKAQKPYIHTTLENTVPDNAVAARLALEKMYSEI